MFFPLFAFVARTRYGCKGLAYLLLLLGLLLGSSHAQAQSPSSWQAIDVALGGDSKPRVLWTHPDGRMALWTLGSTGAVEAANNQGPFSGWTARKVAVGPDGKALVLWTHTSGMMALHRINAQGVVEAHQEYGPFSDSGGTWTATMMSVDALNQPRVVWRRSDGYTTVWTVNTALSMVSQNFFGPFAGWTLDKTGFDSSNSGRFTWNNSDGRVDLWVTTPATAFQSVQHYAPNAGWNPYSLSVAGDGTGWLGWRYSDQGVALWHLDGAGSQTDTKFYGPYSGWVSRGLALYPSPNNRMRVLWQFSDGGINLWNTDPVGVPDSNLTGVYNAPPSGSSATGGISKIALNWSATPNTTGYNIYRSASNSGPWAAVGTSTSATYTDTGAAGGSTYFYQVSATTGGVESGSSSIVSATATIPAPVAPTNLSATPGNAQVGLSWNAVGGATSYQVFRSTTSNTFGTTPLATPTTTTLTDTGLTNGTTYYYVVKATNASGTSSASAQVSATPVAAPVAPTGLSATPGNAQVALSWNATPGATGYELFRSATSNTYSSTPLVTMASVTTYTDSGLSNGTLYYYTLKAVNAGGESASSTEVSATPLAAPSSPVNVVAQAGNAQVALSWDNVANATSYQMFRSTTSNTFGTLPTQTVSTAAYNDTGLANGTTYYYVVRAVGVGGTSLPSNQVSATPLSAPVAPVVSAQAGNAQVTLSWGGVTNATSYQVFRSMTSNAFDALPTQTVSGTSYTDTGLSNGTTYYYVVRAVGIGGTSPASSQVSATPQAAPVAPIGLSATAGDAQVALSWSASTNATGYKVFRATSAGGYGATPLATTTNTSYLDTSAVNGTTYYYSVKATGVGGDSPLSNEVSALPVAPPAPAAPTGLSASVYNNQISLYWTGSTGATSYIVRRATASAGPYSSLPATVTGTYYSDTSLPAGTTYYYRVVAVNSGGQSPESNTASATTLAVPAALSGVTATSGTGQVTLTWNALPYDPNSHTTYSVKRSTTPGGPYSLVASQLYGATYTDTGLVNGTTYYYVVSASNAAGTGPDSLEVSATPLAVPTLSAVGAKARVDLSWNAVTGATGYQVFRSTNSGTYTYSSPLTTTTTQTTYSDSGLTTDTLRYYVVRATVASGSSNSSTQVNTRPLVPAALDLPLASTTGQGVTLSWTVNKFAGFASYVIYRGTQTGVTPANGTLVTTITNQATTSFFDPAPQATSPGNSYFYIVVVNATSGESAVSGERSVTLSTSDLQLHLSASPGDGQATLGWGYGTATSPQGITGWGIKRATTSGGPYTALTPAPVLGASASTYTDSGLTNGTTYFYRVFPVLAGGNGPDSNEASAVPVRAIPTGDIVLTGAAMNGSTRLWWNASTRAVQYVVFRRIGTGDWSQLATVNPSTNPSYTDGGLTNGTIYAYRVRAGNESGDSTDSNSVSLIPNPSAPLAPAAPTFGTVTSTSIQVVPPALPYGATSLNIYIGFASNDATQMQLVASGLTTTQAFTVSGLASNLSYYFRASAINTFGSSSSPIVSISTPSPSGPRTLGAPIIGSISYGVLDANASPPKKGHRVAVWGVTPSGTCTLYVQWKQQGDADSVFSQSGHEVAMNYTGGISYVGYVTSPSLVGSTTYVFRLRCVDSSTSPATTTYSDPLNNATATTLPDPPAAPPAPDIPSASLVDHSVVVNVPALPARATDLTLYWGNRFYIDQNGTLAGPGSGSYYTSQSVPAGATSMTVSGLSGGQALQFLWSASNVAGNTYGPITSITTQGSGLAAPDAPAFLNLGIDSVEVVVPANVTGFGNSVQMLLQAKVTGAPDSTYQTLLFDNGNPTGYYRTLNSAGTSAIDEHPEVGPMDLQRRLLVTNLSPGQSYTLRFVAFQSGSLSTTQVVGAPGSITMPTESLAWSPGPPVLCSGIRYPWTGMTAKSGQVYHLNSHSAADWDILTHSVAGFSWSQVVTGTCIYAWSADSGSFPEGIKGSNVLWQAPQVSVATDVTIALQVTPVGAIGRREMGTRNTTPILSTDRPGQFQATIHVNP